MTSLSSHSKQPVMFVGHGSPMNAIEDNTYTQYLRRLGLTLETPQAILCVSAHWVTQGTWVTAMKAPKTIHDFGGFPQELFQVQYPAPGSPELAKRISTLNTTPSIQEDLSWGLDHGAWSVLRHLFPKADIPVLQLSLNGDFSNDEHFEVGKQLRQLRKEGVLILASGNIVHNLRAIRWEKEAKPHPWAMEFDQWVLEKLKTRDFSSLVNDYRKSEAAQWSVPTLEHYWPLLPLLGAVEDEDSLNIDFTEIQNSSISMLSFSFS